MPKAPLPLDRIAFLGGHPPRRCGIATFTHDLSDAVAVAQPGATCSVVAMNDLPSVYHYPPRVEIEIAQHDLQGYRRAAEILNHTAVDVLSVQHEFGIFGGPAGSHVLTLLREVRMPVVTTLHTILTAPDSCQRAVMEELCDRSQRLVVMSHKGSELLQSVYGVPTAKIDIIPHGIPDATVSDPQTCKALFGVAGRSVLLTFGLLGPGKGVEDAIRALPAVVRHHPDVIYIILGATHPHLVAREGEAYRHGLERLVDDLDLRYHVLFFNSFISDARLKDAIGATDIYLTPYLNEAQITSGTLAHAFGAGHAVVSTPYWHAQELLADGGGTLVPFRDHVAIAEAVNGLLDQPQDLAAIQQRNRALGREWSWPMVAQRYLASFRRSCSEQQDATHAAIGEPVRPPVAILDHLVRMSDSTGMFQHATLTVPNFHEGYSIDDNARAFLLCVLLSADEGVDHPWAAAVPIDGLSTSYLAYMAAAYNPDSGRFRNFMTLDRRWTETAGSEDSHGRTLWALGTGAARSSNDGHRDLCRALFERALDIVPSFTSPRAWAFTLLGIDEFLRRHPAHGPSIAVRAALAQGLRGRYHDAADEHWPWFEHSLTYENARLCQALLLSGQALGHADMIAIGSRSLDWLVSLQLTDAGHFRPIGSNGFYTKGAVRADFDQQPVEAQAMIAACLAAHGATADPRWLDEAQRCFAWFLGRNDLGQALYDPISGGCRDGLHHDRVNENQGAESTLAYHLALVDLTLTGQLVETTAGAL